MIIKLKKVRKKSPEYNKTKSLYKKSFPIKERAPFFLMMLKSKNKNVDFLNVYDDADDWVGFIYVINDADISYIFYLAISEIRRGQGYGSTILKAIKSKYSNRRIFLAIEQLDENADNYDERVRRKKFYNKNGFMELNQQLQEGAVVFDLLGIGGTIRPEEYKSLIEKYLGKIISKIVPMKILEINNAKFC